MPFEAYMAACLGAEEAGYYQTRDPFGEAGISSPRRKFPACSARCAAFTWRICMNLPASRQTRWWQSLAPVAAH